MCGKVLSGRASTVDEDAQAVWPWPADNVEQVNALVQKERQITVTDTANKMDISCGYAHYIIHKDMCHYICARWVPKQLTHEHKQAHRETCMQFLQHYHQGEAFLQ